MTTEEQIKALRNSPKVPDHIKRHFAADCAERAMFAWCERTGEEPFPHWWDQMDAIRAYAEGRIPMKALQEIRETYYAADWAVDSATYWAADSAAYWAASRAADSAADFAAYWAASRAADRAAEREWQLQHFHALIKQHNTLKSRLLGLFNRHATEIKQALSEALKQYEEVVFA